MRGAAWRLSALASFADCDLLRLEGLDPWVRGTQAAVLAPFDRPQALVRPVDALLPVTWRRARRALAALLAESMPWPALRAAAAARIDLAPFQLEPALAMLTGRATRMLLADEVGLGKTIQAALMVAELVGREAAASILIVTPAGLLGQWAAELAERFALAVSVMDAASLARALAGLPRGANPWLLPGVRLVSIDFVKRPEVLQALESVLWDLLVVDEAHGATSTSDRGVAVRGLAARARRVVLVTATPHRGEDEEFRWLCRLGELPDEPAPVVMFRRTRAEVGLGATRRARVLRIALSSEERRLHALLDRYVARVWAEANRRDDEGARLAMVVLMKRALSSAGALALSVARRLAHLGAPVREAEERALPFDDEDEGADRPPDEVLAAPGLSNRAHERAWLGALMAAAEAASRTERKLAALVRLVRRVREPLVVFTEYRDTLSRIAARLAPTADIVLLHGGLAPAERHSALASFRRGTGRVLLATDVAGEGLNLQERARIVVSIELPWTPMRLEQRIGRVDRIGQRRPVHAISLVASGTAEEVLLARLVARLARARAAVGVGAPLFGPQSALAVARAWIAGEPLAPAAERETSAPAGVARIDLGARATREVERLECARRFAAVGRGLAVSAAREVGDGGAGMPAAASGSEGETPSALRAALDRTGPWITVRPCHRYRPDAGEATLPRGVVAVVRWWLADGAGRLVATYLLPVHVPAAGLPRRPRRRDLRAFGAAWMPVLDEVVRVARRRVAAELVAIEPAYGEAIGALRKREAALARAAGAALARTRRLVQPGLFDRRALSAAAAEHRRARRCHETCRRRLAELDAASALEVAGGPEVVLVLLCR